MLLYTGIKIDFYLNVVVITYPECSNNICSMCFTAFTDDVLYRLYILTYMSY